MAQSSYCHKAQNVSTSSWKKAKGFVSTLLKQCEDAQRDGSTPPYQVYRWCVFESCQPCDADCSQCPFRGIVRGTWEDGSPRTFEDVCKGWSGNASRMQNPNALGKLKYSRGFVLIDDAVNRFRKLSRRMWEAQQESRKPTTEGLVYDTFDEGMFGIWNYVPDLANGPISLHVDFGGTNPFAIGFWQELTVEVEHDGKRLKEGAHVLFDEVYVRDVGNVEAAKQVNTKLLMWDGIVPGLWDAALEGGIYRDVAAKAAALDWAKLSNYGEPDDPLYRDLPTRALGGIGVEERVALVYEAIIGHDLLYVDKGRCPAFLEEIGSYEKDAKTGKPVKVDDHHMDGMGYRFWQLHLLKRRRKGPGPGASAQMRPRAVIGAGGDRQWNQDVVPPKLQTGVSVAVAIPRKNTIGM
jgi:hypothetical protein